MDPRRFSETALDLTDGRKRGFENDSLAGLVRVDAVGAHLGAVVPADEEILTNVDEEQPVPVRGLANDVIVRFLPSVYAVYIPKPGTEVSDVQAARQPSEIFVRVKGRKGHEDRLYPE